MSKKYIARASVKINVSADKVWDALTNPALIKQYFFGTEAVSDWKVGSTLEFKGVWEGKSYLDKGVILKSEKGKVFQYSYFSSFSGLKDSPENYQIITYILTGDKDATNLTVTQENIDKEESRKHSEENWAGVLKSLKDLLEKN
jgi:uncharacterized protein YndB with AHSA1/START domain